MTEQRESIDQRLDRLARATRGLGARPGFTDRVMLAAQAASAPGWLEAVALSARGAVAVALVAVVTAVVFAVQSDQAATEASAAAYGALELPW